MPGTERGADADNGGALLQRGQWPKQQPGRVQLQGGSTGLIGQRNSFHPFSSKTEEKDENFLLTPAGFHPLNRNWPEMDEKSAGKTGGFHPDWPFSAKKDETKPHKTRKKHKKFHPDWPF